MTKRASEPWTRIGPILFSSLFVGLLLWLIPQVRDGLIFQYGEDWAPLAGFFRWILGYGLIVLVIIILGLLNFLGPYRWSRRLPHYRWYYRAWLLGLGVLIYQFLQNRTFFEPEWVEENLLVALLSVGCILVVTQVAALIHHRNQQAQRLQIQTDAELKALKAQINPHFLFNALNSLYSQALPLAEESLAKQIPELSGILRFTLQQSQREWISLREEVSFLEKYIALQAVRWAEPDYLTVDLELEEEEGAIPPLLLLPFVENLFVHGATPDRQGREALIRLSREGNYLHLYCQNALPSRHHPQGTGQGLANVRRRLQLLYPGAFDWEVGPQANQFLASLSFPIRSEFL
ncbi:MAG: histidine kinase [Bacteroidota bacterium]